MKDAERHDLSTITVKPSPTSGDGFFASVVGPSHLIASAFNTTETTTMIDHEAEEPIPFETCGQLIPGKPARCTTFRWALNGVRGVKLETFVCGHKRFTTREAISRFILAQNAGDTPAPGITPKQRATQSQAARRELEKLGI